MYHYGNYERYCGKLITVACKVFYQRIVRPIRFTDGVLARIGHNLDTEVLIPFQINDYCELNIIVWVQVENIHDRGANNAIEDSVPFFEAVDSLPKDKEHVNIENAKIARTCLTDISNKNGELQNRGFIVRYANWVADGGHSQIGQFPVRYECGDNE